MGPQDLMLYSTDEPHSQHKEYYDKPNIFSSLLRDGLFQRIITAGVSGLKLNK